MVAYGRIIPARLLEQIPMVNLHFSLLPRWRGAAPVERAILAGDRETGVCLMKVEEGLDTGPVYAVRTRAARRRHHAGRAAHASWSTVASALVVEALAHGVAGLPVPVPQEGEVTIGGEDHARRISTSTGREPAVAAHAGRAPGPGLDDVPGQAADRARAALAPRRARPGRAPARVRSTAGRRDGRAVPCVLQRVQPESRSPMSADDWLRGVRPAVGERLGTD